MNVIQLRWLKDHDGVLDPKRNVTGKPDAVDQKSFQERLVRGYPSRYFVLTYSSSLC
jgi:hypothetical protein